MCGAFLTGDLFNLYVWFEVMLMASFGLLVLGRGKSQLDGGVKYVMINLFATLLFITGIGLLYGMTGTLNMADLHTAVRQVENTGLLAAVAAIFMTAFGIKAGMFPLFFWLPVSYHTPPVAVSAIMAAFMPLSGFWAKLLVIRAGLEADAYWTAAAAIIVGLLTTYSMTKIWGEAFWKPETEFENPVSNPDMDDKPWSEFWMHAPIAALVVLTLAIGFFPAPFVSMAAQAANELLNPEIYVNAVTGGGR